MVLPAVFFDPFDIYDKIIKGWLPEWGHIDIALPSEYFPHVFLGLLAWTILLTYHDLRKRVAVGSIEARPNMPVHEAILYLDKASRWGSDRPEHDWSSIGRELRDAARLSEIQVWGRPERIDEPGALQPIAAEYWGDAVIDLTTVLDGDPEHARSWDQSLIQHAPIMYGLRLCRAQVEQKWPRAPLWKRAKRRVLG